MLSAHASDANIDKLMNYTTRLPIEFQVICLQDMMRRNKEMIKTAGIRKA